MLDLPHHEHRFEMCIDKTPSDAALFAASEGTTMSGEKRNQESRRRVQLRTSSMVGIEGAAPGRETAMAAAREARSRHSAAGTPLARQATK